MNLDATRLTDEQAEAITCCRECVAKAQHKLLLDALMPVVKELALQLMRRNLDATFTEAAYNDIIPCQYCNRDIEKCNCPGVKAAALVAEWEKSRE